MKTKLVYRIAMTIVLVLGVVQLVVVIAAARAGSGTASWDTYRRIAEEAEPAAEAIFHLVIIGTLAIVTGGILYAYARARLFGFRLGVPGGRKARESQAQASPMPLADSETPDGPDAAQGEIGDRPVPAAPLSTENSAASTHADENAEERRILFVRGRFLTLLEQCSIGGIVVCLLMGIIAASVTEGHIGIIFRSEYGVLRLSIVMLAYAMFGCGMAITRWFADAESHQRRPTVDKAARRTILAYGLVALGLFAALSLVVNKPSSFAYFPGGRLGSRSWDVISECVSFALVTLGVLPATMALLAHCKPLERGNMAANVIRTTLWSFTGIFLVWGWLVMPLASRGMYGEVESVESFFLLLLGGALELSLAAIRFLRWAAGKLGSATENRNGTDAIRATPPSSAGRRIRRGD